MGRGGRGGVQENVNGPSEGRMPISLLYPPKALVCGV